jgi:hypothetical protein
MKNIDSEVSNFQQRMGKSMHSLLKAFNDGMSIVEKAKPPKSEDTTTLQIENKEQDQIRLKKMEKVHTGISNLEALTNKLKKSFGNDDDSSSLTVEETVPAEKKAAPVAKPALKKAHLPKALMQKHAKSLKKATSTKKVVQKTLGH